MFNQDIQRIGFCCKYLSSDQTQPKKLLEETQRKMRKAAKDEDFIEAARLRDEMLDLGKLLNK